ncbi:hypothetical protein MN608_00732 [Microdochium nivale]|nr:hypothetical protein MN608_00732 [Microdochium nivale]
MSSLIKTSLSVACLVNLAFAVPTGVSRNPLTAAHAARLEEDSPFTPCRLAMPVMYNLYPGDPDRAEAPTSYIDIQNLPDREEREQVVVFRGVPAGATGCTLGWIQAAEAEREFDVEQNGSTKVKPFYEFPAPIAASQESGGGCEGEEEDPVINYSVIKPLSSASTQMEMGPDFTFWNDSPGAVPHVAGDLPCAEEMYFHVRVNPGNGQGDVRFKQDEKNGFTMSWNCEA